MRKAPLIAAGTVIGAAGVLSFPVHQPHLATASGLAAGSGAAATTSTSTTSTTSTSSSGAAPPAAAPSPAAAGKSATGDDIQFRYGDVAVKLTVKGSKITNVSLASLNYYDGRSASIDGYAIPTLEQQVIDAQGANIQGVSGATFTSEAFYQSLQSALSKLGIQG